MLLLHPEFPKHSLWVETVEIAGIPHYKILKYLYTEVFPRLFPWADFSADEDYYKKWLVVGDTFEEYRRN